MALTRTRWWLPLFSLALGVLCLRAFWIGDEATVDQVLRDTLGTAPTPAIG